MIGKRPSRGKLYHRIENFPKPLTKEMRLKATEYNNNKIREDKIDHVMQVYNEEVNKLQKIRK